MFRKWLHAAAIAASVFTGANAWADIAAPERDAKHAKPVAEKPAEGATTAQKPQSNQ